MAILGWTVLFLVFVDELFAVAAAAVWGNHVANAWLAIAMAALTMLVWFLFASPKARFGGQVVRPVTKVLVFSLASLGLWASGQHAAAIALFVFSAVVNGLAQLPSVKVLIRH
jgi:predicted branched-subunit amino acid permease